MKNLKIILIISLFLFSNLSLSFAKEKPLPTFQITGYIEKISSDKINVFVPRMKKSICLALAKNLLITDFAKPDNKTFYALGSLREKDMAVFEGIINDSGFVCQTIHFVRS